MTFDPARGTVVAIRLEEYRTGEVVGELVLLDQNEMAVRRVDARAGEVIVHFPRIGGFRERSVAWQVGGHQRTVSKQALLPRANC